MFVLDRLWRGEISPSEKYIRQGSDYARVLEALTRQEEILLDQLTAEEKETFAAYQQLQAELHTIESRESFIEGFRMGAGLTLDVVTDYTGEFRNPTEE